MSDNHETRFAPIEALLLKHGFRGYFGYGGGDRRDKGGESFAVHVDIARADDYVGDEGEHLRRVRVVALQSDEVIVPYPEGYPHSVPPVNTPEMEAYLAAWGAVRLTHENRAYADIRRKVVAWLATQKPGEPAEVEPIATDEEVVRSLARMLMEPHSYDSPIYRVAGPWNYRQPNALGFLKHSSDLATARPDETWGRPLFGESMTVGPVGIFRRWPPVQALNPLDAEPPFAWPGKTPNLGPILGTEVTWVPYFLYMRKNRIYEAPKDLPRHPAASVAEAMEAADASLRDAGIWLAEEMVR